MYRLWFTYDDKHSTAGLPVEIGYINVIPKVSQHDEHQLTYEQLPDTYTAINSYLNDTPLLGDTGLMLKNKNTLWLVMIVCLHNSYLILYVLSRDR